MALVHKTIQPWFCIILSALMLSGAYIMPALCAWFVFIFLIPLFYCVIQESNNVLSAAHGFFWGVIFFGIHWFALFAMFFKTLPFPDNGIVSVLVWTIAALQSALWFWIAQRLSILLYAYERGQACMWVVVTTGYFVALYYGMFFFLGDVYGYCFALPLIPLAHYPKTLQTLNFFGPSLLLLCISVFAMLVAQAIVYKKYICGSVAVLFLMPFIYGIFQGATSQIPNYVTKVGWIRPLYDSAHFEQPLDCAQYINTVVNDFTQCHRDIELVILPESTFPYPLNTFPACIELLSDICCAQPELHILVSAHRAEEGHYYNSLFLLHNKDIKNYYDKKHIMPIAEYIPSCWKGITWIQNLFLHSFQGFIPSKRTTNDSLTIPLSSCLTVTPFICSDLFLGGSLITPPTTIICTVNDALFPFAYFRHLMYLYAVFKAYEWDQEMLYVSHYYGVWIHTYNQITLPCNA